MENVGNVERIGSCFDGLRGEEERIDVRAIVVGEGRNLDRNRNEARRGFSIRKRERKKMTTR